MWSHCLHTIAATLDMLFLLQKSQWLQATCKTKDLLWVSLKHIAQYRLLYIGGTLILCSFWGCDTLLYIVGTLILCSFWGCDTLLYIVGTFTLCSFWGCDTLLYIVGTLILCSFWGCDTLLYIVGTLILCSFSGCDTLVKDKTKTLLWDMPHNTTQQDTCQGVKH